MMRDTIIHDLHPRLFATCSVQAPPSVDALIADLKAAGMTAAAWQVETLIEEREELYELRDKIAESYTSDEVAEKETAAEEAGKQQGAEDAAEKFSDIANELHAVMERGGRISRSDIEDAITRLYDLAG